MSVEQLTVFGVLPFDVPASIAVSDGAMDQSALSKLVSSGHLLQGTAKDGAVSTYRLVSSKNSTDVSEAVLLKYRLHYIGRFGQAVQQFNTADGVQAALVFLDVARPHLERIFELPLPAAVLPAMFEALWQGYRLLYVKWSEQQLEGLYAQIAAAAQSADGATLADSKLILAWATLHSDPDKALAILEPLLAGNGNGNGEKAKLLKANALFWKGRALADAGKYTEAVGVYEQARAIREAAAGNHQLETAAVDNSIGLVYLKQGKTADAVEKIKKALDARLAVLGDQHLEVAASYQNIGMALKSLGMNQRALDAQLSALAIKKAVLGERHVDSIKLLGSVGGVYYAMKDYAKALEFYQKELDLLVAVVGEQSTDTATTYENIGEVYKKAKDNENALEMHKKALGIRQSLLGEKNLDTALSYNHVGLLYEQMEDHTKAIEYLMKDLSITTAVLGPNHVETGKSYNGIASVYESKGDIPQAIGYYSKYLGTLAAAQVETNDVAALHYNVAQLHHGEGDVAKAKEHMVRARDLWRKLGNKTDADDAEIALDEWE